MAVRGGRHSPGVTRELLEPPGPRVKAGRAAHSKVLYREQVCIGNKEWGGNVGRIRWNQVKMCLVTFRYTCIQRWLYFSRGVGRPRNITKLGPCKLNMGSMTITPSIYRPM